MERTITGSIVVIGAAAVFTAGALFYEPDDASPAIPVTPAAPAAGRQPAGARSGRTPSVATPTLEISDFSFGDISRGARGGRCRSPTAMGPPTP